MEIYYETIDKNGILVKQTLDEMLHRAHELNGKIAESQQELHRLLNSIDHAWRQSQIREVKAKRQTGEREI